MTRDEARSKCIEIMAIAFIKRWQDGGNRLDCFTAAFDAIHGIATVILPEEMEEMIKRNSGIRSIGDWQAMVAAGDLTNPSEKKL